MPVNVYTTLDDPLAGANAAGTAANGINDTGQIVGWYEDGSGGLHSFLYSGGTYTTLDHPLATGYTVATGINNKGQIVGYYANGSSSLHGFLYSGGTYTTLDDPLATATTHGGTVAQGINASGQIVGFYASKT